MMTMEGDDEVQAVEIDIVEMVLSREKEAKNVITEPLQMQIPMAHVHQIVVLEDEVQEEEIDIVAKVTLIYERSVMKDQQVMVSQKASVLQTVN